MDGKKTLVKSEDSGNEVACAKQDREPKHTVGFIKAKEDFAVWVTSDEIVYIGLPGSKILLPGTEVELHGEPITGKPGYHLPSNSKTPVQTVTKQAMILGAGLATRFEPVSGDTTGYPKPAVPLVGDQAVITIIAKLLKKHGISRLFINTFYCPQSLKHQLQKVSGLEIHYIDEEAPSGTAGGLAKALEQGLVDRTQPILVIQGDAITDSDLTFLLNTHIEKNAAVTIGGQIVSDEDVHLFGIIETDSAGGDGQSGNVTSFKEKPSLEEAGNSRFGNAGFYVFAPEVYDLFLKTWHQCLDEERLFDYAKDFFPAVLEAVQTRTLISNTESPKCFWAQAVGGYWSDMGNPAHYVEAVHDAYAGRLQVELPNNIQEYYENGVIYWPGTKEIAKSEEAKLAGNVIVAKPF